MKIANDVSMPQPPEKQFEQEPTRFWDVLPQLDLALLATVNRSNLDIRHREPADIQHGQNIGIISVPFCHLGNRDISEH